MLKKIILISIIAVIILGLNLTVGAYDNSFEVNITQAPGEMKIDANLEEWSTGTLIASIPQKASECSGIAYFMYDKNNLYIAGVTRDNTPMKNANINTRNCWNGDALEIYISTSSGSDPERTSYNETDRQIGLVFGETVHTWCWQLEGKIKNAKIVAKIIESDRENAPTGYTFEAKIPLESINPDFNLKPGMEIGFASDYSFGNKEGVREVQPSWNAGQEPGFHANPSYWGIAKIK